MVRPITYGHSKLLGLVEEMIRREFDPEKASGDFIKSIKGDGVTSLFDHSQSARVQEHNRIMSMEWEQIIEYFVGWLAERIECPKCKGRGMYSSIVKQIGSEGDKEVDAFCWDCDGSGSIQRVDSPEFRSEKK